MEKKNIEKEGYIRITEEELSKEKIYTDILKEHNVFEAQRNKRKEIIEKIEKEGPKNKKIGVLAFVADEESIGASIGSSDIPAIGSALLTIGEVDILRLILNSPGGDGTIAEKIIEMCRSYCKKFEVIIPNRAKSAATLIALGSDEIIMGYCSELGPIDAQIAVVLDGFPKLISAQSFIDARKQLIKQFKETNKRRESTKAILQQIATLNIPFIEQCEKYMDFSKDLVTKYLSKYMFKKEKGKRLKKLINNVLEKLSSTETFKVHGRFIDGHTAKHELKLNSKLLGKYDKLWKLIWEYYFRADIGLGGRLGTARGSKMVETKGEFLIAVAR